jgi:UDP-N-acetylmuramyl pentapeptide phosphotransferase/UDP-N-acetylglucosamine-1-phosphate transferase
MHNILAYVAVIAVGAVVTLVANVPARKISLRIGYTALPDERKVHQVTTPYGGGAAMLVGFCVATSSSPRTRCSVCCSRPA